MNIKKGSYVKLADPFNGPNAEPVYATVLSVHSSGKVRVYWEDPDTHDKRDIWVPADDLTLA